MLFLLSFVSDAHPSLLCFRRSSFSLSFRTLFVSPLFQTLFLFSLFQALFLLSFVSDALLSLLCFSRSSFSSLFQTIFLLSFVSDALPPFLCFRRSSFSPLFQTVFLLSFVSDALPSLLCLKHHLLFSPSFQTTTSAIYDFSTSFRLSDPNLLRAEVGLVTAVSAVVNFIFSRGPSLLLILEGEKISRRCLAGKPFKGDLREQNEITRFCFNFLLGMFQKYGWNITGNDISGNVCTFEQNWIKNKVL